MVDSVCLIGRYALYGEIAAGGMATVHFGRLLGPIGFSLTVAIKRLHAQLAKDPGFVAVFLDEAQLAASILCGALHGLHAAHEARNEQGEPLDMVHRDISPQSILVGVGVDGTARVLDFGVAKASGRATSTGEGHIKGKIAYMAPEQFRGEVTRQIDVYACAILAWEALTGEEALCRRLRGSRAEARCGRDVACAVRVAPGGSERQSLAARARMPKASRAMASMASVALERRIIPIPRVGPRRTQAL